MTTSIIVGASAPICSCWNKDHHAIRRLQCDIGPQGTQTVTVELECGAVHTYEQQAPELLFRVEKVRTPEERNAILRKIHG